MFTLALHDWYEPPVEISSRASKIGATVAIPRFGEWVDIKQDFQTKSGGSHLSTRSAGPSIEMFTFRQSASSMRYLFVAFLECGTTLVGLRIISGALLSAFAQTVSVDAFSNKSSFPTCRGFSRRSSVNCLRSISFRQQI